MVHSVRLAVEAVFLLLMLTLAQLALSARNGLSFPARVTIIAFYVIVRLSFLVRRIREEERTGRRSPVA